MRKDTEEIIRQMNVKQAKQIQLTFKFFLWHYKRSNSKKKKSNILTSYDEIIQYVTEKRIHPLAHYCSETSQF